MSPVCYYDVDCRQKDETKKPASPINNVRILKTGLSIVAAPLMRAFLERFGSVEVERASCWDLS
jgi:hypothetical protein